MQSGEFGQPLEFYTCAESTVIIITDPEEGYDFIRAMLVIMNKDTIYRGYSVKHEIEINLINGEWSNL